jgi:hypothetical protein
MLPPNLYARVRVPYAHLHTRPRVRRAPGLPCALHVKEGQQKMQTSDAMRRENANTQSNANTHSIVITRESESG